MDTLQSRLTAAPETVQFSPEVIDAISAIQSAHKSLRTLADKLRGLDPALLEDFGFGERIDGHLDELSGVRSSLLHLLADLADYTW